MKSPASQVDDSLFENDNNVQVRKRLCQKIDNIIGIRFYPLNVYGQAIMQSLCLFFYL